MESKIQHYMDQLPDDDSAAIKQSIEALIQTLASGLVKGYRQMTFVIYNADESEGAVFSNIAGPAAMAALEFAKDELDKIYQTLQADTSKKQ